MSQKEEKGDGITEDNQACLENIKDSDSSDDDDEYADIRQNLSKALEARDIEATDRLLKSFYRAAIFGSVEFEAPEDNEACLENIEDSAGSDVDNEDADMGRNLSKALEAGDVERTKHILKSIYPADIFKYMDSENPEFLPNTIETLSDMLKRAKSLWGTG